MFISQDFLSPSTGSLSFNFFFSGSRADLVWSPWASGVIIEISLKKPLKSIFCWCSWCLRPFAKQIHWVECDRVSLNEITNSNINFSRFLMGFLSSQEGRKRSEMFTVKNRRSSLQFLFYVSCGDLIYWNLVVRIYIWSRICNLCYVEARSFTMIRTVLDRK